MCNIVLRLRLSDYFNTWYSKEKISNQILRISVQFFFDLERQTKSGLPPDFTLFLSRSMKYLQRKLLLVMKCITYKDKVLKRQWLNKYQPILTNPKANVHKEIFNEVKLLRFQTLVSDF